MIEVEETTRANVRVVSVKERLTSVKPKRFA